jgi:hypothetical protein
VIEQPTDNQDKLSWFEYGEQKEIEFLSSKQFTQVALKLNPEKESDKTANDLIARFRADLKTVRTVFKTADRYGLDPKFTIAINRKDVEHYVKRYPNILIIFDIDIDGFQGVKIATLDRLLRIIYFGTPEHSYIHREKDDQGNAKSSFLFDLRLLDTLST